MDRFRLLHLSDLHIAAVPRVFGGLDAIQQWWNPDPNYPHAVLSPFRPSSHDPKLLDALAHFARDLQRGLKNHDPVHAILLTGDAATTGRQSDLDEAREFVSDPPLPGTPNTLSGAPTLQGAGVPVLFLAGNHDRFDGRSCDAGGDLFDTVFHPSSYPFPKKSNRVTMLHTMQGANKNRLGLLAADFTLAKNQHAQGGVFDYLGQGAIYPKILKRLVRETKKVKQDPKLAIVWVLHFPPEFPGISSSLKLLNDNLIAAAAQDASVPFVLAGHTHDHRQTPYPVNLQGATVYEVLCAGSASQYYAPNGNAIHLIEFEVDHGQVRLSSPSAKMPKNPTHLVWSYGSFS